GTAGGVVGSVGGALGGSGGGGGGGGGLGGLGGLGGRLSDVVANSGSIGGLTGGSLGGGSLGGGGGLGGGGLAGGGGLGGIGGQMGDLYPTRGTNSGSGSSASSGDRTEPVEEFVASLITPSLDRVLTIAPLSAYGSGFAEDIRQARLKALIQANRATLDRDLNGAPVRKLDLVVTNPDPVSLSAAIRSGFRVIGDESIQGLGIRV